VSAGESSHSADTAARAPAPRQYNASPPLLIFDLDGTLVDSQHGIARSFNHALVEAAAQAPIAPERVFALIGLPLTQMFAQTLPEADEARIAACIAVYRAHNSRHEIPRTQPFPGVHETLAALRTAGRTLTVATTKTQEVADLMVDAAGLRRYFALVLGGDAVPHHKPHPALVLRTLADHGHKPHDAIVVGDSNYDILMAAGAGVRSCGVTYGAQPAAALRAAGATHLIDAMPELLPLVGLGA